ncbi:hypothetical protein SADUNF_Sadunf06G0187100 [Salix dunnii]|uniref:Uncharacterized protein n=1 Tax=Salix dunnii TaxID=1413687 RepID=A0A835N388_9ROSI|nr:hypothetical protein SADUNF_Sadunf06G0187100 [Salix dunnii]
MKLKSNLNSSSIEAIQHDEELYSPNRTSKVEPITNKLGVEMVAAEMDEISAFVNDGFGGNSSEAISYPAGLEKESAIVECRSVRITFVYCNLDVRRKAPGFSWNKRALEVNLPETFWKFITCIRIILLFYLKLLEVTGDICTLDQAFLSLEEDKRVKAQPF